MMKKLTSLLPALLAAALLVGCRDKTDNPQNDLFSTYDRAGMLTSLRDRVIVPAYADFATTAAALETAANALRTTPDSASLRATQNAWRATELAWTRAGLYDFGPAETLNLMAAVDHEEDPAIIESALNTTATIDAAYVNARPSTARGVGALQYLLFDRTGGNAAILQKLTTGANAAQRRAYVAALAANLRQLADNVKGQWTGGAYPGQFVAADGNDVNSSIGLLTNQLVALAEDVKNGDLGKPLGDQTGGTIDPTAVEGYASATSLALIEADLQALEATFLGNQSTAQPAPGFDDLLDHLGAQSSGQPLSAAIKQRIAACKQKLAAIPAPLDAALATNPQAVRDLQTEVKQLIVLIKVDMVSRLGVLLTFTDNDGD